MPASIARIALTQHNWDKQDLLSKFFDDQDKFFQKINVLNPFQDVATTSTASTSANIGECLTCYGEYPSNVSQTGLFLYKKNWTQYLCKRYQYTKKLRRHVNTLTCVWCIRAFMHTLCLSLYYVVNLVYLLCRGS